MGWVPSEVWAQSVIATLESTRVSSSTAIAYCSVEPPAPPTDSGKGIPIQPSASHLGDDLVGKGLGPIELGGGRGDLGLGELADRALQQRGVVIEVEEHADEYTEGSVRTSNLCSLLWRIALYTPLA